MLERMAARTLSAPGGKPQQEEGLGPRKATGFAETPSSSGPGPSTRSTAPGLRVGGQGGQGGLLLGPSPPGVCGAKPMGSPGLTHSGSKTREGTLPGDWQGRQGSGPGGHARVRPSKARREGGVLPCTAQEVHCHVALGCVVLEGGGGGMVFVSQLGLI